MRNAFSILHRLRRSISIRRRRFFPPNRRIVDVDDFVPQIDELAMSTSTILSSKSTNCRCRFDDPFLSGESLGVGPLVGPRRCNVSPVDGGWRRPGNALPSCMIISARFMIRFPARAAVAAVALGGSCCGPPDPHAPTPTLALVCALLLSQLFLASIDQEVIFVYILAHARANRNPSNTLSPIPNQRTKTKTKLLKGR